MQHWMTVGLGAAMAVGAVAGHAAAAPIGAFADHRDIGNPALPGSAVYHAATRTYRVTGGGTNMWAGHDDFHFVWRKALGNISIETALQFTTPSPAPSAAGYVHRKGGVIIRQDLDPDSVYVDALRMGNRQLSLQYRAVKGGPTRLIWINTGRQQAVRLEKIGDYAYLSVPGPDGRLHRAGGSFRLKLTGPYLVGLAVCPHDNSTRETMAFRDVRIGRPTFSPSAGSTVETIQIANPLEQTALLHGTTIEVAGWSADARSLYARKAGRLYRAAAWDSDAVELATGGERPADPRADAAVHAPGALVARSSPDGQWLAYLTTAQSSARSVATSDVALHLVPLVEGKPQAEKSIVLSEFRGSARSLGRSAWSPDSKTIAFVAED